MVTEMWEQSDTISQLYLWPNGIKVGIWDTQKLRFIFEPEHGCLRNVCTDFMGVQCIGNGGCMTDCQSRGRWFDPSCQFHDLGNFVHPTLLVSLRRAPTSH